jgi:hypothetical protein
MEIFHWMLSGRPQQALYARKEAGHVPNTMGGGAQGIMFELDNIIAIINA